MKVELVISFISLVCSLVAIYLNQRKKNSDKSETEECVSENQLSLTDLARREIHDTLHAVPLDERIVELENQMAYIHIQHAIENHALCKKYGVYDLRRTANDNGSLNLYVHSTGLPSILVVATVYDREEKREHYKILKPHIMIPGTKAGPTDKIMCSLWFEPEIWSRFDYLRLYIIPLDHPASSRLSRGDVYCSTSPQWVGTDRLT